MSSQLSVAQVLANLEAQMAFHREREAHHAEREAYHREQRAAHAAEYENVAKNYEAFKATAGAASELAARSVVPAPAPPPQAPPPEAPLPTGKNLPSKLVARVVADLPAGEVFTPSRLAAEIERRFGRQLRKPIGASVVSTVLRRLLAEGTVRRVEEGTSHREATYTNTKG